MGRTSRRSSIVICRLSNTVTSLLALAFLALIPAVASAQSSIAGLVRDTSGAVMPGVTVEVASPVLIEKVRSGITDEAGRYNIVDLRPGAYTVTFTLAGFKTIKREGLELPASFTMTVNAELEVGGLEETLTVSGQAPLVDTQNTTQNNVLSTVMLEAVPSDRYAQGYALLIPGASGGATGTGVGLGNSVSAAQIGIHGSLPSEHNLTIEGYPLRAHNGGGATLQYYLDPGTIQELVVTTGSAPAEQQEGGLRTTVIPKEGGDRLSGDMYFHYLGQGFVGNNLTPALKAKGVTATNSLRKDWDINPSVGGPIKKDVLWFFASYRNSAGVVAGGIDYNLNPTGYVYKPDTSRPSAAQEDKDNNYNLRLTWQATPKNKFSIFFDDQPKVWYDRSLGATTPPEATYYAPYSPQYYGLFTWKAPVSSHLLLEAGVGYNYSVFSLLPNTHELGTGQSASPNLNAVSAVELTTGMTLGSANGYGVCCRNESTRFRTSASYVTGTHNVKVGLDLFDGTMTARNYHNGDLTYSLRNGVPVQLTEYASTLIIGHIKADMGLYAQDQWVVRNLTLNLGVRYDYWNSNIPAQNEPANSFLPARSFGPLKDVVTFNDIDPRLGVSYNLFGTGKTALKAALSRYVAVQFPGSNSYTYLNNPVTRSVLSANRTWTPSNPGDFTPNCDFSNPAANGDCGALSNVNFGQNNPNATTYDPSVLHGWGKRPYSWETSAEIQHELFAGLSVNGGYFRRSYGNFTATQNLATTPADFSPYCLKLPVNPALPDGGNQLCGFYDVSPAKFGKFQNYVTFASKFSGQRYDIYNGVDATVSARFHNGAQVVGGVNVGREEVSTCQVINSPQDLLFCDVKPPFRPNIRFHGVYPLPWWGLSVSGNLQGNPGAEYSTTTYAASSAEVASSLGRSLSTSVVTLPIIQPGTLYYQRWNRLDLRFTKTVKIGATRVAGSLDVFNALNGSGVHALNVVYGQSWLVPTEIEGARVFRFAAQFNF